MIVRESFLQDVIIYPCHNFKGGLTIPPLGSVYVEEILPTVFDGCDYLSMTLSPLMLVLLLNSVTL